MPFYVDCIGNDFYMYALLTTESDKTRKNEDVSLCDIHADKEFPNH